MFQSYKEHIKSLLIYVLVTFFITILYIRLSAYWVAIGGWHLQLFYFEIPFLCLISLVLYFPSIKRQPLKYIVPVLPTLVLYLYFDIFYNFLSRSPRPSDVENINTIFNISIELSFGFIAISLIVVLCVMYLIVMAYRIYSLKLFVLSLSYKLIFISAIIVTFSSDIFLDYFTKSFDDIFWSHQMTIRNNGRFASVIYHGSVERQYLLKLDEYISSYSIDVQGTLYPGDIKSNRNIHLVVLESLVDPRLFSSVQFNRSPVAIELEPYLHKQSRFSQVISPVYGGNTAQAEFELLTGVKALAKLNSIEFNVMNGSEVNGFVSHLKQRGYITTATVASSRQYFNSPLAYRSIGFDEVSFLEDSPNFEKHKNDVFIFDGSILEHNIEKIKGILQDSKRPVFNYVLGMYGHFPYKRNLADRPDIIEVDHKDKRVHRISNQFFYRTKAIAKYINDLLLIDPNSIIYITSDHLPPVIGSEVYYKLDKYINISLFIDAGIPLDISGTEYFKMPWIIWDILSGKEHKRYFQDGDMERLYFKVLSESMDL